MWPGLACGSKASRLCCKRSQQGWATGICASFLFWNIVEHSCGLSRSQPSGAGSFQVGVWDNVETYNDVDMYVPLESLRYEY
jgi:hypothetical protein